MGAQRREERQVHVALGDCAHHPRRTVKRQVWEELRIVSIAVACAEPLPAPGAHDLRVEVDAEDRVAAVGQAPGNMCSVTPEAEEDDLGRRGPRAQGCGLLGVRNWSLEDAEPGTEPLV